ncbi:MAG TPA: SPOR domain-containing protein, partial [Burkholderiaceae bacterium]|nr:SPOR domain-containing protein [Burkholderiaceae bacterium]
MRARRRLIGAAALLGIGVIGFPLLFETQPRPIPVDIAIDIPKKDGAPSLPLPAPRTASAAPARVSSGVVGERAPAVARSGPAQGADSVRKELPAARSGPPAAAESVAKTEPRNDDGARAKALLEGQGAPAAGVPKPATTVAA